MSDWISVKDRLPETRETYFISDGKEIDFGYWYTYENRKKRWAVDYGDPINYDAVTHWQSVMPLPDPPEEEKK